MSRYVEIYLSVKFHGPSFIMRRKVSYQLFKNVRISSHLGNSTYGSEIESGGVPDRSGGNENPRKELGVNFLKVIIQLGKLNDARHIECAALRVPSGGNPVDGLPPDSSSRAPRG